MPRGATRKKKAAQKESSAGAVLESAAKNVAASTDCKSVNQFMTALTDMKAASVKDPAIAAELAQPLGVEQQKLYAEASQKLAEYMVHNVKSNPGLLQKLDADSKQKYEELKALVSSMKK